MDSNEIRFIMLFREIVAIKVPPIDLPRIEIREEVERRERRGTKCGSTDGLFQERDTGGGKNINNHPICARD